MANLAADFSEEGGEGKKKKTVEKDKQEELEHGDARMISKQVGPLFKGKKKPATSSKQALVDGVEEVAIRLVRKLTDMLVPAFYSGSSDNWGHLGMSIIPGCTLDLVWSTLDDEKKKRLCHVLLQGLAEFGEPSTEFFDYAAVRARIFQRHVFFSGQRNETERLGNASV